MLRRLFCLMLGFLMLANQSLCLAHVHHGMEMAEPKDQASRPHFHMGGHGHIDSTGDHKHDADHAHDHRPSRRQNPSDGNAPFAVASVTSCADHETDVVYVAESVTIARDSTAVNLSVNYVAVPIMLGIGHHDDSRLLGFGPIPGQLSSVFDAACPVYLRTLSLRI